MSDALIAASRAVHEADDAPGAAPGRYLVALEQCGLELQAPHLVTRKKRRIDAAAVDVTTLADDSLRFVGWAEDELVAVFPDLDPAATYHVEATFLCERSVRRVVTVEAGDVELPPEIELAPATATVVEWTVPPVAYLTGPLQLRVRRVEGPDVTMSELRLFSSKPVAATITVVGDARGGLIGAVGTADSSGVPDVAVRVGGVAAAHEVRTDARGVFRVPLDRHLPLGQNGLVTVSTGDGATTTEIAIDTRDVPRGLRELPPPDERVDLNGEWRYQGGPSLEATEAAEAATRVPGHIVFDGLVPDAGIGTFRRSFELPDGWAGRAVFLRCDGAYGQAEVRVNGSVAGRHGSGATSFDVDITPFVRPGANELAITLAEFSPYAVLDDMSWYAHMSLLGIWRDVCLFSTPLVHLGQLRVDADWEPVTGSGSLELGIDVINLARDPARYVVEVSLADGGTVIHRSRRSGSVAGRSSTRESVATGPIAVAPWSAEQPRLHDLEVVLRTDVATHTVGQQTVRRRVGFRRVETRGNQLLVNGRPIRVRGVNRHDSRILKGRALAHADMRDDIVNLRRTNVNVIRTSHYPPSPYLLEVCDEVGMFVFEQPPICFSGGFDDHHWTRTNEAAAVIPIVLEVTAETVARDAGHPSVIVWDLGNESRWGPAFDAQLALVREMDGHRPTIFSFDLNELGPENLLVRKPDAERPDIRSYHYPGWDRTWEEDLAWLGAYDQPTVLDEYMPVFAPCLRGPGEGYGLAIDPGIRDYWGAGYQPFAAAALHDHGVIGGLVWGGFGEVFAIPLDLTIGDGPWAHLPVTDYVRTNDHYPTEPGVFRRGDGDWGLFDGWNRPRPERWHVHQMYSPIEWTSAAFDAAGDRLDITVTNRFSHRSLAGLRLAVVGGELENPAATLTAGPGESQSLMVRRDPGFRAIRLDVWHEEGWLVDAREWSSPLSRPLTRTLRESAGALEVDLGTPGALSLVADGRRWLRRWPELHVLDVDEPHVPVPSPTTDGRLVRIAPDGAAEAPLSGHDWQGAIRVTRDGATIVVDYEATYVGTRPFNAKEVGLTLHPSPDLRDLWWHRRGEWSTYPDDHVGRNAGYAAGAPGSNGALRPAATWDQDATAAGSNDYRSAKRSIVAAGMTDGQRSLTVLSDGSQHARAELVDGLPVLHVLDWYGGVRTIEGNHPIWSAYFSAGRPIATGTRLAGRIVLAATPRPPGDR